ncbi:predicted protein [Plenodomus lingam JN3]|uniref:Predicted protein n=1 Tax=Leptosphaeria maculans (strain JN3 / isolate v23.1.3 / race Av1-4-5-6-7-8) TaxID=985895 RepID=E5A2T2_LEPMJ|nr:predicted protein [Plenodomus lingam JN3]CBX97878.1 predicted protein [Plenodomus lingam JN3]
MSSIWTAFLPLTTIFTAPAECWNSEPWIIQNVATTWWKQGSDLVASCFPPAFPFSLSSIIYSPGLCPEGWTSACDRQIMSSGQELKVVLCCPAARLGGSIRLRSSVFCRQSGLEDKLSEHDLPRRMGLPAARAEAQSTSISSSSDLPSRTGLPEPASTASFAASSTSAFLPVDTTPSNPSGTTSDGLSKGSIAGIAVGSVIGIALISLLRYIARALHRCHRGSGNASLRPVVQDAEQHGKVQSEATHYQDATPTEMGAVEERAISELTGR